MTKVRKQKKAKKYRYHVNRKRMNKKKYPTIGNQVVKAAWSNKKSSQKNMLEMGLVYDVNKIKPKASDVDMNEEEIEDILPSAEVAQKLEEEANAPRIKQYRLPKNQVEYLSYLLDTYGEDYKAMAKDKRNYLQHTWKKIRSKIRVFKSIPEQYNEYLNSRNK